MSMSHKAFVFDYDGFQSELRGLLEHSLQTGNAALLNEFINARRSELKDPYEGEPLDEGWESLLECKDAHQYGDFALTLYYGPSCDIGLGTDWQSIREALTLEGIGNQALIGEPVGPASRPFDPGKMGSYFQSPATAHENWLRLEDLGRQRGELGRRSRRRARFWRRPWSRARGCMSHSKECTPQRCREAVRGSLEGTRMLVSILRK